MASSYQMASLKRFTEDPDGVVDHSREAIRLALSVGERLFAAQLRCNLANFLDDQDRTIEARATAVQAVRELKLFRGQDSLIRQLERILP